MDNRSPVPEGFRQERMASEPQKKWIRDLIDAKNLFASPGHFDKVNAMDAAEYAAYLDHIKTVQVEQMTMSQASKCIDSLLKLEDKKNAKSNVIMRSPQMKVQHEEIKLDDGKIRKIGKIVLPDGRTVLEGSYGIDTSDDDRFTNDVSFFRVWIAEGYGKGWGVKMYTSDYTHRVNLAVPTQIDAIVWIADDPVGAAKLFGHEFKRCGVCYRGLTKDESRAAGIGPVCGARLGIHVY